MGWRNLRYVERSLAPYALTFPQAMVLTFLHRLGPDLLMSQIAECTGLPASTITSIMDRLVKSGLAERQQGFTDRRRITGSITDSGFQLLKKLEDTRNTSLSIILETFSDEELVVLARLVDRWAEMMESEEGGLHHK